MRLKVLNVDLTETTGKVYDKASAMAGHVSGVQKRILSATFVRYVACCFNLTVMDQSEVSIICNTCDIMRETVVILHECPKHQSMLNINLLLLSQPDGLQNTKWWSV